MNENQIALFDMDSSLADYDSALRWELDRMRSPFEPPLPDNIWSIEHEPYLKARMQAVKDRPGFWLNLEPIQMGFDVYHVAREIGFAAEILTKGPKKHTLAWAEKIQWCQKHLGDEI